MTSVELGRTDGDPYATATRIVRAALDEALTVVDVTPMTGGMVSSVQLWTTDGDPREIVAKLNVDGDDARPQEDLAQQYETLAYFRRHTAFPVPEPLAHLSSPPGYDGAVLLMSRLPGRHLGDARLTAPGMCRVQQQMADHLVELHGHTREHFGSAVAGEQFDNWLEWFAPRLEHNVREASPCLDDASQRTARRALDRLDNILADVGDPTLVHGDIWATNVIVDDRDPERPTVSGYVDGSPALFADREYELAYLQVFRTVDGSFFEHYERSRPRRDGYELRRLIYWLNTILLHVWIFGDEYAPRAERLCAELAGLL